MSDLPHRKPAIRSDDILRIFDADIEQFPWSEDDALPMDDDGNILPGNDTLDEDPNDNGDKEGDDPDALPEGTDQVIDPDILP